MRREPPPLDRYLARARERCFICEVLAGTHEFRHPVVYSSDHAIAFLNRYPVVEGYVLVASREHRERVTADFSENEYVDLQRAVYRVGEAVRRACGAARIYVLSLGSNEANAHVHWHVAPLPPGVPFEQQQLEWLSWERGVLDVDEADLERTAELIRREL